MDAVLQEDKIRELAKQATVDVLQEEHELPSEVLVQALEDLALANAMREGECGDSVDRTEVLRALE